MCLAKMDFENKIMLAPMVRVCTYPFRLLALKYGADMVYTEKIMDWRLIEAKREVNPTTGTIDFISRIDGSIVFRTCEAEKPYVVLQIGTGEPQSALAAAKKVEHDVAAIDINMGDPKEYSQLHLLGSALLADSDRATDILSTLVQNLTIPVSCKIRILDTVEETMGLIGKLAATKVKAIAVHGRTKNERSQVAVRLNFFPLLCGQSPIPIIANGGSSDFDGYTDILKFRDICGATSVMVGRAAQWNCSIFRKEGRLPVEKVISDYLDLCVACNHNLTNAKFCIQTMLQTEFGNDSWEMQQCVKSAANIHVLSQLWNLEDR
jgi:tRNA-dihydrouridine synthase 2